MDPLSIAVSTIALLQATAAVSKGLRVLWGLKDAQNEVDAVLNEISALETICNQVNVIVNEHGQSFSEISRLNNSLQTVNLIQDSMEQSQKALDKLRDLINNKLLKPPNQGQSGKVWKLVWLKERRNFTALRENVRSARLQLSQSIGLCDMFKSCEIEYQIDSLMIQSRAETVKRAEEVQMITNAIQNSHDKVALLETHVLSEIRALGQLIRHNSTAADNEAVEVEDGLHIQSNETGPGCHLAQTEEEESYSNHTRRNHETFIISARPLRPQSTSCNKVWCTCVCHSPGIVRTPAFLSTMIGSLLVGYSDIPHLTPLCNIAACKKRRRLPSLRVNYFFPRWFLSRVITTTLMYSSRDGLDVHRIRVPRVISHDSAIFRTVQKGDIEGIRRLFMQGLASPYDVDQDGFSPLWFTLDTPTTSSLNICRLMLTEGADPYECVNKKNGYLPSFESAWQLVLGKSVDEETANVLKIMFDDPDRLNEFHFSDVHKWVLKLDGHGTSNLKVDPLLDIDCMDAFSRTPLYWAIERSDRAGVLTLLERGANPNIPTPRSGWTSMHFVARAHSVDEQIIAALLNHGAEANALDCNSQTPLSRALRHDDGAAKVKALIAGGADPNIQYDEALWSASHLAVFLGRHDCVRTLLELGADFSLKTVLGSNVVHLALRYADLEMMQVFSEFKIELEASLRDSPGDSLEYLQNFRQERGITPITDAWWSLWSDIQMVEGFMSEISNLTNSDWQGEIDSNSDNGDVYEDAAEVFEP